MNADQQHRQLVEAAKAALERAQPHGSARAAAVRTRAGTIHAGVELVTRVRRASVCAELVALGTAVQLEGDTSVVAAAAVELDAAGYVVTATPCGYCREVFSDYVPDAVWVLGSEERTTSVSGLLPLKYERDGHAEPAAEG